MSENKPREWTLLQIATTNKHGHLYPQNTWNGPEINEDTLVIEHSAYLAEKEKIKELLKFCQYICELYSDSFGEPRVLSHLDDLASKLIKKYEGKNES